MIEQWQIDNCKKMTMNERGHMHLGKRICDITLGEKYLIQLVTQEVYVNEQKRSDNK